MKEKYMTTIECQDIFLPDTDLNAFGNELKANNANLQTPLNATPPITSKRTGITKILILDPIIEFDEMKVKKAVIEVIMNKYRFKERP
jgi:hypothetical protein